MGSCIICGASVDGRVCDLHEEDVVFEFTGTKPQQLIPNRYYRGTVDGYAEFGIFVDIGDHVTGLLHKSELDRRLDSVDLDPGDTVFVQVQNVRDNGNIDLGWSIRQDKSRFRGALVHDPESGEDHLPDDDEDETAGAIKQRAASDRGPVKHGSKPQTDSDRTPTPEASASDDESEVHQEPSRPDPTEVTVSELDDHVGQLIRIEGEVVEARQTSGPTVFQLRDETGTAECAAFEEAGVRAYPEVEESDVVRIEGEVERRHGEVQVETEALVTLEADERAAVTERMEEALVKRARPGEVDPLVADPAIESITGEIQDAATAVRRAVIEGRPIVVRHAATADGYLASAAIERATLPLIREEHQEYNGEYHYFERRPLEGSVYDMNDATRDVTRMLENQTRHDEQLPLFLFVAAGGTAESLDGFDLLDVYGARRVVIDDRAIDTGVEEAVDVLVSPEQRTTATVLGVNVAVAVNDGVREDIAHLPAVSFPESVPDQYVDLAAEQGYDGDDVDKLREAVTLEAHYQSYEDKRELVTDLLFADGDARLGLAEHISEQFRTRMESAIETAEEHLEELSVAGGVLVLDTDAYTHRFEFPAKQLLLEELFRRHRDDTAVLVGLDRDQAFVYTDADIDVRDLVELAREHAPQAGLDARGAREGRVEFLSGEREATREALLSALDEKLSAPAA